MNRITGRGEWASDIVLFVIVLGVENVESKYCPMCENLSANNTKWSLNSNCEDQNLKNTQNNGNIEKMWRKFCFHQV